MKKYGKIISKLRKEKGLTQEALGKKLNVSYQAVSKWENDLSEPDLATLETLVEVLGVSMSDFFALSKNEEQNKQTSSTNLQSTNIQLKTNDDFKNINYNQTTKLDNKPSAFDNFVKNKTWFFVAIMASVVLFLSLFVFFIPAKLSSDKIYQKVNPSVFCITAENSSQKQAGSGFFINNNGLAVTNYHVIENCTSAKIQLDNGAMYDVIKVVGCDEKKDIAIIQIDIPKSQSVLLGNSNKLKVGQVVYAIGYPESFILGSVDSTFTQGIISKTTYSIEGNTYIQCTADITNGNSGGVLIDEYGKVVGITTARFIGANYINMCIPINEINFVKRDINLSLNDYYNIHKTFYFYSEGLVLARKDYISGDKISKIADPTKTGYTFDGWWTSEEYNEKFDFDKPLSNQTACYAKWIVNKYTIRFDANGASGTMQEVTINYDEKIKLPKNEFVYSHYKFVKWESADKRFSLTDQQSIKNLVPENGAVIELKAIWQMEKYTLNFDANGADSGEMQSKELGYFDTLTLTEINFSRTGYLFKYWKNGDRTFEDQQEISQLGQDNEQITLLAVWEPITYFIKFDSNNEKNETKVQEIKYDQKVNLLANTFSYSENEKAFYSWEFESESGKKYFDDQQEILNLTSINNQTLIFKVYWGNYYYIFNFDTNGGEGTYKSSKVTRHDIYYFPYERPTKAGYSFFGWVYNEQTYHNYYRMEDVDFGIEEMPKEITFVAKYTPNTYTINYYEAKKIDNYIEYINLLDTQTMTYDVPAKLKDGFTIWGRKLKNWIKYVRQDYSGYRSYTYNIDTEHKNLATGGQISLVADWAGVEFDVVYHNLNGPDDTSTKTVRKTYNEKWESDSSVNAISGGATAHGYVFTGWTFNDVFYEAGTKIFYADDMKVEENGTYHFYANWEDAPTCTIQFYANGGEGEMQTIVVYTNESYYLPECLFTKAGYTFRFWSIDKECDVDSTTIQDFNRYEVGENFSYALRNGRTITLWANWLKIDE